jgi:hypothetical protein
MDKNPLGPTKITSIRGTYIFDDTSLEGDFSERRAKLNTYHPNVPVYKLKERVLYLRHLVKYKSGTIFVDRYGNMLRYKKSSKLFNVYSRKIMKLTPHGNWTIVSVRGHEQPLVVGHTVLPTTTHASIMETQWGSLLYDLTNEQHEMYKRKI